MEKEKYIPGVCNIGPQERKLRQMAGWIGTAAFLALYVYFRMGSAPLWARFLLIIPALVGSVGFLQYYAHFCVNFGMRGLRNMDKPAWQTETVDQDKFRQLDRQKSLKMILTGLVISLAATALAYWY